MSTKQEITTSVISEETSGPIHTKTQIEITLREIFTTQITIPFVTIIMTMVIATTFLEISTIRISQDLIEKINTRIFHQIIIATTFTVEIIGISQTDTTTMIQEIIKAYLTMIDRTI